MGAAFLQVARGKGTALRLPARGRRPPTGGPLHRAPPYSATVLRHLDTVIAGVPGRIEIRDGAGAGTVEELCGWNAVFRQWKLRDGCRGRAD